MWCHLCMVDFTDFQSFKIHIIEKHRKGSELESSESEESEHEITESEESEISDDEKAASNIPQVNYYDLDPSMTAKNESDDNTTAANMSQENGYDSDNSIAAANKSDDTATSDSSPEKCYDSDHNVAAESNSVHKTDALVNSDEDTSVLNTSPKKRNPRSKNTAKKSGVNASVSNKSRNKPKLSSVLKKRIPKKKKKVVFSKQVLPKRRMSAVKYQEDRPEHSDSNDEDHSKNSFNGSINHVNPQFVPSNSIVDPEPMLVNNYVNSQPISNNNPVLLVNPYVGQGVNNYVMGNQAIQPPVYVINTVVPNSTTSKTGKDFDFCSSNILKWLTKHKELCKNVPYPLPPSMYDQVTAVHKAIFDHYWKGSSCEAAEALLKVYEELDCMIHKHVNSISDTFGNS